MTAASNYVIKKYDGTTSITWTVMKGSGGDTDPAVWRSETATGTNGQRPTFQLSARSNGDGTVRRLDFKGVFPSVYTETDTSLTKVLASVVLTGSIAVPQGIGATDMQEACGQLCHLIGDPGTVAAFLAGYAPT
jgi:hypothetical protein